MSEIRYARTTDGTHVAYEISGDGPVDLVVLRAWHTDIEHEWNEPVLARLLRRLGSRARVIRFDRRGMGLSDRVPRAGPAPIEVRLDDLRAVLEAARSRRPFLVGLADGATLCAVFAATYPDRTRGLVMWEPSVRWRWAPDYPWGWKPEEWPQFLERTRAGWGTRDLALRLIAGAAPSRVGDERFVEWLVEHQSRSGSAEDAVALAQLHYDTDITAALRAIHVPTLVLAREASGADEARYVAERVPSARMVTLPGADHFAIAGDTDAVINEIQGFVEAVTADRTAEESDRVLATLLFTDVVGSTDRAVALGDRAWAAAIESHQRRAREIVEGHRGRLVDTAGDGVLAAFDGPGRAIRCAQALVADAREMALEIRAGLHAGECEQVGERLRGLAVHLGARVGALAGPSEILVSSTVVDLVAGAGYEFDDRGQHELKGIPGRWRLFAVR